MIAVTSARMWSNRAMLSAALKRSGELQHITPIAIDRPRVRRHGIVALFVGLDLGFELQAFGLEIAHSWRDHVRRHALGDGVDKESDSAHDRRRSRAHH
jgi:hypothetical protein